MTAAAMLASTLPPPSHAAVVHTCSCGIGYSFHAWIGRALAGFWDADEEGLFEMRTCSCGSTRSVLVAELLAVDARAYRANVAQNHEHMRYRANHAFRVLARTSVVLAQLERGA